MTINKKKSTSLLLLVLIALLGASWLGVGHVNSQLTMLPIKDLPKQVVANTPIDIKKLYPVLVEFITKQDSSLDATNDQIDQAFSQTKKEVAPVAAPIDYVQLLRQSIQLQAVTNTGAIINGTFVKLRSPVPLSSFTLNEVKVKPVLASIDTHSATIRLGSKSVKFTIQK